MESLTLTNPHSLEETIRLVKIHLAERKDDVSLNLFAKAIYRAAMDVDFAAQFEDYLLNGSTLEGRAVFEVFGEYMQPYQGWPTPFPHSDAVNGIDSALHSIKYAAYEARQLEHAC